jgi:hypothetical protein
MAMSNGSLGANVTRGSNGALLVLHFRLSSETSTLNINSDAASGKAIL